MSEEEKESTESPESAEASEAPEAPEGEGAGEAPEGEEASAETAESGEEASAEGATDVRQAEFQPLTPEVAIAAGDNINLLMDVTVPVTIDLGGTRMTLREVLGLGPGSVVKLDRPLGEPVDIKVNGELVGRGDVVVVDDQFGVQVTELRKLNQAKK